MSYAAEVLADSPLAFWKLDETAGTSAADSSGSGRTLTYSGATLGHPALTAELAAAAKGANSGQGVGSVASASWMNLAAFSVECLVEPANADGFRGFLSRYQFAPGGWLLFQDSQQFAWDVATTGADNIIYDPDAYAVDGAYHLVGTYDGTTAKLYVNGVLVVSSPVAGGGGTITQPVQVGGYAGANFSQATVNAAAIYGTALSGARVLAHYRATSLVVARGKTEVAVEAHLRVAPYAPSLGEVAVSGSTTCVVTAAFDGPAFTHVSVAGRTDVSVRAAGRSLAEITVTGQTRVVVRNTGVQQPFIGPCAGETIVFIAYAPDLTGNPPFAGAAHLTSNPPIELAMGLSGQYALYPPVGADA